VSLDVNIYVIDQLIRDMRARLGFRAHNLLVCSEFRAGDTSGTQSDGVG
jgi:hypothetical protein